MTTFPDVKQQERIDTCEIIAKLDGMHFECFPGNKCMRYGKIECLKWAETFIFCTSPFASAVYIIPVCRHCLSNYLAGLNNDGYSAKEL